jgi:large conductance mechanosensitive channel
MGMIKEFKEFSVKGNVIDLAVGIIIGGAFGTIVKSLVDDVIMPPIGLALGGVDFANLFLTLREGTTAGPYPTLEAAKEAGAVVVRYGLFLNSIVTFLIVAFAVFLLVRAINSLKRKEAVAPSAPDSKACPQCATTIPIAAKRCPNCTSQLSAA